MPRKKTSGQLEISEVMQGYLAALAEDFAKLEGRAAENAEASLVFLRSLEPSRLLKKLEELGIEDPYRYYVDTCFEIANNPKATGPARLQALDRLERMFRAAATAHPTVEQKLRVDLAQDDDGLKGMPDDQVPPFLRILREKRRAAAEKAVADAFAGSGDPASKAAIDEVA